MNKNIKDEDGGSRYLGVFMFFLKLDSKPQRWKQKIILYSSKVKPVLCFYTN